MKGGWPRRGCLAPRGGIWSHEGGWPRRGAFGPVRTHRSALARSILNRYLVPSTVRLTSMKSKDNKSSPIGLKLSEGASMGSRKVLAKSQV